MEKQIETTEHIKPVTLRERAARAFDALQQQNTAQVEWQRREGRKNAIIHLTRKIRDCGFSEADETLEIHYIEEDGKECVIAEKEGIQFKLNGLYDLVARVSQHHQWMRCDDFAGLGEVLANPKPIEPPAPPAPPATPKPKHIANGELQAFPDEYTNGLTKREYFAALALQGELANESAPAPYDLRAKWAVEAADELLKALSAPAKE
jgi:ribosomal protein L7/L12